ncbi:hypothetical protein [Bergeyella sp. RCAD1439]|uniref:hypothetical protein n=1 Tax=Bergeyella anatis TaxID=3113737 RepID=UPI002E176D31|nr:hypothetical protein [Bergeyella sp. RCAD1439]
MKKLLSLSAVLFAFWAFAQCNIVGRSNIGLGASETYQVENNNAQCPDCHQWTLIGGTAQIEGEFRKNNVKITPLSSGRSVLSLAMLTAQGVVQCSKSIDVGSSGFASSAPEPRKVDCDIDINGYKEVKYAQGIVSFFPSNTQNEYKYSWTAVYSDGTQKSSLEKVPQFEYSAERTITLVKVKITSTTCMKELSKTYETGFWKFF